MIQMDSYLMNTIQRIARNADVNPANSAMIIGIRHLGYGGALNAERFSKTAG